MIATPATRLSPQPADRLVLRPVTADLKQAMDLSVSAFAKAAGVIVPDGWPEFPQAFRPVSTPHPAPWTGYLILSLDETVLLGNCGFVAPPDESGTVEIGYEIAPRYRNRGYATEAARMLIRIARTAGAQALIAHSLAEPNASNAVMWNAGMSFSGERHHGPLTVWRWRIDLSANSSTGLPRPKAPQVLRDSQDNAA